MDAKVFKNTEDMDQLLEHIKQSPKELGTVDLIVCRPLEGERKTLENATLNPEDGLLGDSWKARGYKKGPANSEMQINIMNSRALGAIEENKQRWPLAGDQFYVNFDISKHNLPPGTRIKLGSAILQVTAEPHLGCKKFSERFGKDAVMWVNSTEGKALNLRGINAKVIEAGEVSPGANISKL